MLNDNIKKENKIKKQLMLTFQTSDSSHQIKNTINEKKS
jgi:hypothetical protein